MSSRNPRYFTVADGPDAGRAVYLTGAHVNNNFHDGLGFGAAGAMPAEPWSPTGAQTTIRTPFGADESAVLWLRRSP